MIEKISKLIEYGLYLLVFLLPLQTRWIIRAGEINGGYSEYSAVSLYGTDILLIILIILFIIFNFQFSNNFQTIFNFQFLKHSAQYSAQRQSPEGDCRAMANPAEVLGEEIAAGRKSQINSKFKIQNYKFLILWLMIAGLALSISVSIFFAPDKIIAVCKFGVFLLGIGLFWLITSAVYDKLKLICCFLVGAGLQAALAVWQFLTQSGFANKWLGIALHNAATPGASVIEAAGGGRWIRAYGGLDHPNALGGLLAVGILIIFWLIAQNTITQYAPAGQIPNPKFQIPNKFQIQNSKFQIPTFKINPKLNYILLCVMCCMLCGLFFTFSRAAWLGLAAGLLTLAAGQAVEKNYCSLKKLLKLILAGGVLIIILSALFYGLVFTRISSSGRLEAKSTAERIESMASAAGLIKNNWLFGVGIGNYIAGIRNQELGNRDDMPSWHYQPVHNVFLLVWAEIGISGLLFFILIPLSIIHYPLFKNNLISKNFILKLSLLAALAAMFMLDHWWWSLHFGVLLSWLVLGIIISFDFGCKKAYYNDN